MASKSYTLLEYLVSLEKQIKDINNKSLDKIDYFYVSKDNNSYNLFTYNNGVEIKVFDDFNNFLLKENENYIRNNTTLTFNYNNPQKIRVEYY